VITVLRGVVKDLSLAIQHRDHRVNPAVVVKIAEGQCLVRGRK
jgi:hypothetical protein